MIKNQFGFDLLDEEKCFQLQEHLTIIMNRP